MCVTIVGDKSTASNPSYREEKVIGLSNNEIRVYFKRRTSVFNKTLKDLITSNRTLFSLSEITFLFPPFPTNEESSPLTAIIPSSAMNVSIQGSFAVDKCTRNEIRCLASPHTHEPTQSFHCLGSSHPSEPPTKC